MVLFCSRKEREICQNPATTAELPLANYTRSSAPETANPRSPNSSWTRDADCSSPASETAQSSAGTWIAERRSSARSVTREGSPHWASTRAGKFLGTPSYVAPEQAQGWEVLDERADLYSVGAVLFACLTQKPPFTGEHVVAVTSAPYSARKRSRVVPCASGSISRRKSSSCGRLPISDRAR